jgi:aminoglycoside phosphotransferase (APT) family kinase protein
MTGVPATAAVEAWLRTLDGFGTATVQGISLAEGGVSNITCRVVLEGAPMPAVAVRVQRDRGIFEPYDVLREGELLRRLAASPLPVPAFIAAERDTSFLGAPFIAMEWIDAPHMGIAPDADFGAFTRAVVDVHSLNWRALGLDFLGVPASAHAGVRRELAVVAARMHNFACDSDPLLRRALEVLDGSVPADGRLALCQGDINVFNYLFRRRVVASSTGSRRIMTPAPMSGARRALT